MPPSKPGSGPQWATKAHLAQMLGRAESTVEKIRRAIGYAHEQKTGNHLRFFLPDWLEAWSDYRNRNRTASDTGEQTSDSPHLEEKRKWDAKLAQMRYEKEKGLLIPIQDVRVIHETAAAHLRTAGEAMCEACRELVSAAMDDATDEVEQALNDCDGAESPTD